MDDPLKFESFQSLNPSWNRPISLNIMIYAKHTTEKMIDANINKSPPIRINAIYKSVGSPSFTVKQFSIFQSSFGLINISKPKRNKMTGQIKLISFISHSPANDCISHRNSAYSTFESLSPIQRFI